MTTAVKWIVLIAIVFSQNGLFAQTNAKKNAKLLKVTLTFETLDDSKDKNTTFICYVTSGTGITMGYFDEASSPKEFVSHSVNTIVLSESSELTKKDCENFSASISVENIDNGPWNFNAEIRMVFSDGSLLIKRKKNVRFVKEDDRISF